MIYEDASYWPVGLWSTDAALWFNPDRTYYYSGDGETQPKIIAQTAVGNVRETLLCDLSFESIGIDHLIGWCEPLTLVVWAAI